MHYQIKPEIKIGSFGDFILDVVALGKVMILTSKSLNEFHRIQEIFGNERCHVITDVEPELPFSYVENLYSSIESVPDIIIAIGGGSVMDLGKALSVAKDFSTLKDFFEKKQTKYEKHAQLFSVPTTFGSGAETSFGSILYDDVNGIKDGLRSSEIQSTTVIIDPQLYSSASPKLMAESGFDCLTHAIETYLSKATNEIVKFQSVVAINTVFDHLANAVFKKDKSSIVKMGIASMMMGINLAYSSTCLPHRIQYIIGPMTKTSHAQGLSMLYKGWIELIRSQENERSEMQNLLKDIKMSFSEFEAKILSLRKELDINYGLADFGVNQENIDSIARSVVGNLTNDPFYKDINSIRLILSEAL
jgi:alcohol dehydrogenase class IV